MNHRRPAWLVSTWLIAGWLIVAIAVSIFHWWQGDSVRDAVWYQVFLSVMLLLAAVTLVFNEYQIEAAFLETQLPVTKCNDDVGAQPMAHSKRSKYAKKIMFSRAISLVLFLMVLTLVMAALLRDVITDRTSLAWLAVFTPAIIATLILCIAINWCSLATPIKICMSDFTILLLFVQILVLWAVLQFTDTSIPWALLLLPSWFLLVVLFFAAFAVNCSDRCRYGGWCARVKDYQLAVVYYYAILFTFFLLLLGVSLAAGDDAPLSDLSNEHRIFIATVPFLLGLSLLLVLAPLTEGCCVPMCVPQSPYLVLVKK